jgi:hypothetical protein
MSGGTDNIGAHLGVRAEPFKKLTLFLTFDYEYRWWIDDDRRERWDPSYLGSAGGILRLPAGIILNLAVTGTGSRVHMIRNPKSNLDPMLEKELPARLHLLTSLIYGLDLGRARVNLGLSIFHLFGGRYRESHGVVTRYGSNFGGELMGTQAIFTARVRY